MSATNFPRFSELPRSIQEKIWCDALSLNCNLRMLGGVSLRAETWYRGTGEPRIDLITGERLRPIIDSRKKHSLFVNSVWYHSAWWSIMSTSIYSRKVALKCLSKVVEEGRRLRYGSDHKRDLVRLLKAAIADLDARLSQ